MFDSAGDRERLILAARSRHVPVLTALHRAVTRPGGEVRLRIWLSGLTLDLAEECCPPLVDALCRLNETGCVEWLPESYYHSLALLYSPGEFREQVDLHAKRMNQTFGAGGRVNPGDLSGCEAVSRAEERGDKPGGSQDGGWGPGTYITIEDDASPERIEELLKTAKPSARRPSVPLAHHSPLTHHSYPGWVASQPDHSPWLGSPLASDALHQLYSREPAVRRVGDPAQLHRWRCLQASDHFRAMVDGREGGSRPSVARSGGNPYEAYINFMAALDAI